MFREECARVGRAYNPSMIAVARALQMVRTEEEREAAFQTRRQVLSVIGDLARGERPPEDVRDDDAPLLGTPREIVTRLRQLQTGGVERVLLVDPKATIAGLRHFAAEVMPALVPSRAAAE